MMVTELELILGLVVTFTLGVALGQFIKVHISFDRPMK